MKIKLITCINNNLNTGKMEEEEDQKFKVILSPITGLRSAQAR